MSTWIPLFDLGYGPEEEEAVLGVLRSRWLTMGEETLSFERSFAQYLDCGHAVAVSSGTAALHLAVHALGIGPGDEVIVPDLTFVATANAVLYEGATPVLADVTSAADLTVSPQDVAAKITPRTRAIIVMHYAGFPCDMETIRGVAEANGLFVIEDAAHAPGATYGSERCGTMGDAGCFSFYSNKNLATGEGGMLTTSADAVADRVRHLRSHSMTSATLDRHKGRIRGYDVTELGYNYRLTEIEAALGSIQLAKLDAANEARSQLVAYYHQLLTDIPGLEVPFGDEYANARPAGTRSSFHLMVVLLPPAVDRNSVAESLGRMGVQTSFHYPPLHTLTSPLLASASAEGLDNVKLLTGRLLTLPLWAGMTRGQVDTVVASLSQAIDEQPR